MSATETVDLTINATEVHSVNDVAAIIVSKTGQFANHYGCGGQFDAKTTEDDLLFFFVKRKQLGLERLEVHILEDGEIAVGEFSGRRKATLVFNIHYVGGRGYL